MNPVEGKTYIIKHTSGRIVAKFIRHRNIPAWISLRSSFRKNARHHYIFENLKTGREVELKSTAKILSEVEGSTQQCTY